MLPQIKKAMVKRRFHHSFFQWSGSVFRRLCLEGKRIQQDMSVLSFQIRLVEEDFDEGSNDLRIEKDGGAAEDFTGDFSLCLL